MREYGSEHPAVILSDGYFKSLEQYGRDITYLRSGREALLYTSANCKPNAHSVILCPAYSCWSMIEPFRFSGWEIAYYALNEDLTINQESLRSQLRLIKPSAVLTMNYFSSSPTEEAVATIKDNNKDTIVIEDFSHCTFCYGKINNDQVDYYVSSIRKSVGVSDGAIVLSKTHTNKGYLFSDEPSFSEIRSGAQREKYRYFYTCDQAKKGVYMSELKEAEAIVDKLSGMYPISRDSLRAIESLNGTEIAFARRENMKHLWHRLNGEVKMVPGLERSFDGAPFALPILVEDRDEVQHRLAAEGVYAPVLWPIDAIARSWCTVAANMADKMLAIPIDQRYGYEDIEDIARIVINTCCSK